MTQAAARLGEQTVETPASPPPGPHDSLREALEFVARNLADLRERAANLGDESLAALVSSAWQEAASLLLKCSPVEWPLELVPVGPLKNGLRSGREPGGRRRGEALDDRSR